MGWISQHEPCKHPDRPEPTAEKIHKVWRCENCGRCFEVVLIDFGHDVMDGEQETEYRWLQLGGVR